MVLLATPLTVIWWPGCRQYPPVSSKESLKLMKLLYAACNTRNTDRLTQVEQGVEELTREGKMTPAEREGFDKIIGLAKAGNWEKAEAAAFKFAQDQVGVGHPAPDDYGHHSDEKEKAFQPKGKRK